MRHTMRSTMRHAMRRWSAPLIGPEATDAELALSWGAALLAGVAQALTAAWFGYSGVQAALAVVLAVDVGGGVVVNSTPTGRAYWHRPAYRRRGVFFAAHVHVLLVAALWPAVSKAGAAWVYAVVTVCAAITARAPRAMAMPIAVALTSVGVVLTQPVPLPAGLEWLPALLLLKLVVGHAVPPWGALPPR